MATSKKRRESGHTTLLEAEMEEALLRAWTLSGLLTRRSPTAFRRAVVRARERADRYVTSQRGRRYIWTAIPDDCGN